MQPVEALIPFSENVQRIDAKWRENAIVVGQCASPIYDLCHDENLRIGDFVHVAIDVNCCSDPVAGSL